MSTLSDLLQVLGASWPQIVLMTLLGAAGYIVRGWWEQRQLERDRRRVAREVAMEAAAETSKEVKMANIQDQQILRRELWDRVEGLEARLERERKECEERAEQRDADHAAELSRREAIHAEERAYETARNADQISALRAESAECKQDQANLRADLAEWRGHAERLAELIGEAGSKAAQAMRESPSGRAPWMGTRE